MVFSIIIVTHNRPNEVTRSIESVLKQSFKDYELLIINDGSTKDYSNVQVLIKNHSDIIRYFYKKNEERSVARNFAINKALGKWICFLDDDDWYENNHLGTLYMLIKNHKFKPAIYHTLTKIKTKTEITSQEKVCFDSQKQHPINYYLFHGYFTMNNYCAHRSVFEKYPFPPDFNVAEDKYQQMRAMTEFPVFYSNTHTTVYDRSQNINTWDNYNYINALTELNAFARIFSHKDIKRVIDNKKKNELLAKKTYFMLDKYLKTLPTYPFYSNLINYLRLKRDYKTCVSFVKRRILKV